MITISLCMIVKNEEKVLKRCLDSVVELMDEMIIVDTGSTDRTKEIASEYPRVKLYDYAWANDFAAARNFAFSKAGCEYIYSADADEILEGENKEQFSRLKQNLTTDIEIVQMKYGNQLENGSVYNFDEEYRPKLFKRIREFYWISPVHETIRTTPVIYDSDIIITHKPEKKNTKRDLQIFDRYLLNGGKLDSRLWHMYAQELYLSGDVKDYTLAKEHFEEKVWSELKNDDEWIEACVIIAKGARLSGDDATFFQYIMKAITSKGCSEACYELGEYYAQTDPKEAKIWYYNACYVTAPYLDIRTGGKEALEKLAGCCQRSGEIEEAFAYEKAAKEMS